MIFLSGYLVLGTIEIITRHGRNRTAKSPGWEGGSQKNAATAAREWAAQRRSNTRRVLNALGCVLILEEAERSC